MYKLNIENAYQKSIKGISKITDEIINMDGMSGIMTRHFYNNLLNTPDARYLEIGTWKGSSVCSAMCENNATVVCIDNWSEFGGPKEEFICNFNKYKGNNNARFIECDCYQVDVSVLPKFNIYMYDGNHSYENHYNALMHYINCLDDIFIYIVDDWNWSDVREGTYKSIKNLDLKILYEKEIRLTWDNTTTDLTYGKKTWWNGIYIAILEKKKHKIETLKMHYNTIQTELCEMGRKYDTDKSSIRDNITSTRHCHPYTIFYDGLFKDKKDEPLNIGEIGILEGSSLLMWREYFKNSTIYGFEYNLDLIHQFKQKYNQDRINLSSIDVTNEEYIKSTFNETNIMYDVIIDDSTHQFNDQIKIIENVHSYLKPGGILIIEDIFKSYNEQDYFNRLEPILHEFETYYFVELDHVNKMSEGWDNDKLLIFVKKGNPIFRNNNKLTIITPCYRTNNLMKLYNSINFKYVDQWIIVYDGSKIKENLNLFHHDKIYEYVHHGNGISGNPQRNYALTKVNNPNTLLYYLDDDNIIHPSLYNLLNIIDNDKIYTFDQFSRLTGNNPKNGYIDTAMIIIPYKYGNYEWSLHEYNADGIYIEYCINSNKYVYINNDLCYYNKILN